MYLKSVLNGPSSYEGCFGLRVPFPDEGSTIATGNLGSHHRSSLSLGALRRAHCMHPLYAGNVAPEVSYGSPKSCMYDIAKTLFDYHGP